MTAIGKIQPVINNFNCTFDEFFRHYELTIMQWKIRWKYCHKNQKWVFILCSNKRIFMFHQFHKKYLVLVVSGLNTQTTARQQLQAGWRLYDLLCFLLFSLHNVFWTNINLVSKFHWPFLMIYNNFCHICTNITDSNCVTWIQSVSIQSSIAFFRSRWRCSWTLSTLHTAIKMYSLRTFANISICYIILSYKYAQIDF